MLRPRPRFKAGFGWACSCPNPWRWKCELCGGYRDDEGGPLALLVELFYWPALAARFPIQDLACVYGFLAFLPEYPRRPTLELLTTLPGSNGVFPLD